ncbi:MAG: IclR family transcriptional regulator domain-containing protein, partial [Streptosporangiaceae bacterium]
RPTEDLSQRMAGVTCDTVTETTIRDMEELGRGRARIRPEGIGRDEGEHTAFVYCVAAPVHGKSGAVVAAMSCSLPEPPQRRPGGYPRLADVVSRHAAALSRSLGWDGSAAGQLS